jgi:hypothetical protein
MTAICDGGNGVNFLPSPHARGFRASRVCWPSPSKEAYMPSPRKTFAILYLLPALAAAQMPSPGLWQIGAQTQAVGLPLVLAPMAIEHCLTPEDARDPSKLLGRLSSPGATSCAYTNSGYSGSNFHFAMECAGAFGIKATGDVAFTATTLTGAIDSTASLNGQAVAMRSTISAQRLGDCPAARPAR